MVVGPGPERHELLMSAEPGHLALGVELGIEQSHRRLGYRAIEERLFYRFSGD